MNKIDEARKTVKDTLSMIITMTDEELEIVLEKEISMGFDAYVEVDEMINIVYTELWKCVGEKEEYLINKEL